MNSKFLGIAILVVICATIVVVGFLQTKDTEDTDNKQNLVEYDIAVIQVIGSAINVTHRVDTLLVDTTGNRLFKTNGSDSTEIKRYYIWGWKQTSNVLWNSFDSLRSAHGLKEKAN